MSGLNKLESQVLKQHYCELGNCIATRRVSEGEYVKTFALADASGYYYWFPRKSIFTQAKVFAAAPSHAVQAFVRSQLVI